MLTIPEIATQLVKKSMIQPEDDQSRTLILVGNKSAGKSTLLYSFLDKTDPVRETTVLEYSFGRKSTQKQNLDKTICHIWEYGGKLEMFKNVLASIPSKGRAYFCIVLDLSKIKSIWTTLETCTQAFLEHSKESSTDLIIIGSKYDIYKNYDGEIKKIINTTIRSVAMLLEGNVIYYSSKDPHQLRKVKDMLFNISFGNGQPFKEKSINPSRPFMIPKNSDSWESISIPATNMENVKMRHVTRIQPEVVLQETSKCDLQRSHPEPILDSLMAIKYQELRNLEMFEPSLADYFR